MKIKKNHIIALVLLMFIGCSSVNKSQMSSSFAVNTKTNTIKANIVPGEAITGEASGTYLFGLLKLSGPSEYVDGVYLSLGPVGKLKAAAAYNATNSSDCDVILNPQYIVKTTKTLFITNITVEVTGYKGTIKNFTTED